MNIPIRQKDGMDFNLEFNEEVDGETTPLDLAVRYSEITLTVKQVKNVNVRPFKVYKLSENGLRITGEDNNILSGRLAGSDYVRDQTKVWVYDIVFTDSATGEDDTQIEGKITVDLSV